MLINSESSRMACKTSLPRILVVDDHADTARTLRQLLESSGFGARSATCYRDAITECAQWIPDLLVGDIAMPDGDGYELLDKLRQSEPTLKAIAISGYATAHDAHKARAAGYDQFFAKPFHTDRLIAAILRLLSE